MRNELVNRLYEYMLFEEQRARNDMIQLYHNVAYRDADHLDHLEMILARHRLEVAQEIFVDVRWIIRTYRNHG